jgi:hypothetical protein
MNCPAPGKNSAERKTGMRLGFHPGFINGSITENNVVQSMSFGNTEREVGRCRVSGFSVEVVAVAAVPGGTEQEKGLQRYPDFPE